MGPCIQGIGQTLLCQRFASMKLVMAQHACPLWVAAAETCRHVATIDLICQRAADRRPQSMEPQQRLDWLRPHGQAADCACHRRRKATENSSKTECLSREELQREASSCRCVAARHHAAPRFLTSGA